MAGRNTIALQETVSASAVQLPNTQVFDEVTLYAASGNTGTVYLGNASTVSSSNGFPLEKGTSVKFKGANLNSIYYVGTASDKLGVFGS